MKQIPFVILFILIFDTNYSQTVDLTYINPKFLSTNYDWLRFGNATNYYAGFMYNRNLSSYGNGDDFTIFTYGNRDISFLTGTGNVIFFPSTGGKVGIGTTNPKSIFHTSSNAIQLNSTASIDANLLIEAKSNTRTLTEGATLGFAIPANTDGGNLWQQGRIIVTPDNTSNASAYGRMYLQTRRYDGSAWSWINNLILKPNGNVGVGEINPLYRLSVNGTIGAKEVKVTSTGWSDFVFEPDYALPTLHEVENYIDQNGHLPDIPSAEEVEENGISLGEMDAKLLQKIEELTLYVIEQNAQLKEMKKKNEELLVSNLDLKEENQSLKTDLLREIETIKTQLR